jgi:hypothetical protein
MQSAARKGIMAAVITIVVVACIVSAIVSGIIESRKTTEDAEPVYKYPWLRFWSETDYEYQQWEAIEDAKRARRGK